jgi:hypothetical protein
MVVLTKDRKEGFADLNGVMLTDFVYDYVSLNDGFFVVKRDGKFGTVDLQTREVIPCTFDHLERFIGGRSKATLNNKYGYIDTNGNELIPIKYDSITGMYGGMYKVFLDGKYGAVDKAGNENVPAKYDEIIGFVDGVAWVKTENLWGIIDAAGNEVASLIAYEEVREFCEGRAAVKQNGWWGFVDTTGKIAIKCKYREVEDFDPAHVISYWKGKLLENGEFDPDNSVYVYIPYTVAKGKLGIIYRFIDVDGKGIRVEGRKSFTVFEYWLAHAIALKYYIRRIKLS